MMPSVQERECAMFVREIDFRGFDTGILRSVCFRVRKGGVAI
jgi:hypothetical protein